MRFSSPAQNRTPSATTREGSGLSFVPIQQTAECIVAGLREAATTRRTLTEEAWVAFLSCHEWQWFGTFTYKDSIHPEAADKQFRFWSRLIDQAHRVPKTSRANSPRRLMWIRGLEWQKRGVLHYHALMRNVPGDLDSHFNRYDAEQCWLRVSGGFARIERLQKRDDAIAYVAKYATKGGEVDLSPNFELHDGTATAQPLLAEQTTA